MLRIGGRAKSHLRTYARFVRRSSEGGKLMSITRNVCLGMLASVATLTVASLPAPAQQQQKRPNIVMLMTDDTGWNDFGAYTGGGAALGHPTPNIDRIAKEGVV